MGVHARLIRVGINIATSNSWGTGTANAIAVGAGDGHYVRDELGIQRQTGFHEDDSAGQTYIGAVQSSHPAAIDAMIPTFLHYNDVFQNVLWALVLGNGGTTPTQLGASTAYTNTFEPSGGAKRYATIVRYKSVDTFEVPGAKFTGFELRSGDGGRLEIDWKFVGNDEISDSVINTTTQVSALTFPTLGLRAFFDQLVFRINSQSGGALGASDAIKITSFKLTMNQPVDTKYVGGQLTIIEPEDDGFPSFEIAVTFARFDAASLAFFDGHRDGTKYKADLTITGPVITGATNYGLLVQFPNVYLPEYRAPVPGGAGQVQPFMRIRALSTTTAPTGMTGVTVPMRVVTTGTMSSNPFA